MLNLDTHLFDDMSADDELGLNVNIKVILQLQISHNSLFCG